MNTREDVHRLVDEIAADRLDEAVTVLRPLAESEQERPRRRFRTVGVFDADPDLGARAKDFVRRELSGDHGSTSKTA